MSFRRRKSRIGPGFQAIIPVILSTKQKQEFQKLYDYEQSLSEHCLTLSQLPNPSLSLKSNLKNNANTHTPMNPNIANTTNTANIHTHSNRQFTINDTGIDHLVDPICFEISKSHTPQHFNYHNYVKQCQLFPKQVLQTQIDSLQNSQTQTPNTNDKKRKREKEHSFMDSNTNNSNSTPNTNNSTPNTLLTSTPNTTSAPPNKKQKLMHQIPPLPLPSLPMTTPTKSPFLPNTLLTPSPPHSPQKSSRHLMPAIPPLPSITNQCSSPTSPLSLPPLPMIKDLNKSKTEDKHNNNSEKSHKKKKKSKKKSKSKKRKDKKDKKRRDRDRDKDRDRDRHTHNSNSHSNNESNNKSKPDSNRSKSKDSNKSNKKQSNADSNTKQNTQTTNTNESKTGPIPLKINKTAHTTQPPPPTFLPPHMPMPIPGMPPIAYPYPPPHISYTHYNPQFYYMHTTYTYAPKPNPKTLNPKLIKKQRIDNKSCEVIDLCDEDKVVTQSTVGYQYPPPYSTIPGMPQFPLPPPMVLTQTPQTLGTVSNPFGTVINKLVTPPPIKIIHSAETQSETAYLTPTNSDITPKREEKPHKKKKGKTKSKKSGKKVVKNEGNNVVNNKINIKSKHVGLFESLLTPKTASNHSNSSIINRVLTQPLREGTEAQYQKLGDKKHKKHRKKIRSKEKIAVKCDQKPTHSFPMAPFPLMPAAQMIPYNPSIMPLHLPPHMMGIPPHLRPMMVPSPMGTPFVLTNNSNSNSAKREYTNAEIDTFYRQMSADLSVGKSYNISDITTPKGILGLNKGSCSVDDFDTKSFHSDIYNEEESESVSDSDSDFSPSEAYVVNRRKHKKAKAKQKHKHKKSKHKKHKKSKHKIHIRKSSRIIEKKKKKKSMELDTSESNESTEKNDKSEMDSDEHKESKEIKNGLFLDSTSDSSPAHQRQMNSLFNSSFNVSPNGGHSMYTSMDNSYSMNRSASPPFMTDEMGFDMNGSLPFRPSPEFGSTHAFGYENGLPLMDSKFDIDAHSLHTNYA